MSEAKIIYQVYYYWISVYLPSEVKLAGIYDNEEDAITRLRLVVPNFRPHNNKTVTNGYHIGWICRYTLGDYNQSGATLHNLVSFENQENSEEDKQKDVDYERMPHEV